ncbi:tetratricopeptide repeat protein [Desulfovibrio intestinalis]|uniref:Tetratricopeptide (TPR) repeat protein n=1 Tax=Desulfovibrio intestinalis TaxID=58621 RepID=A0A7W8BZA8_9BACT|nr:tetratricopeptide repeat protein [Desulfovibrio intestinalis]MBB5142721.1 tetratricopeptide (TPR) repeat protein [Desulfovibrio intestinalis]
MKRKHIALFCALTLAAATSFSLLGCGGCAGTKTAAEKGATAEEVNYSALRHVEVRQPEEKLSPEAKSTYAFLLYSQALNDEDEAALLQAAPLMAAAKLPANIWLEGGVWLVSRKSAEAAPYLEQGLAVAPDDMSLNLLYAEALMEQGTPERGVQLMRAFLAKHPGSLDARLELALLLVKSKEYAEAETLLNSVSSKERTPLVDYYHARALIGMDRSAEAIPFLQKAIKEMPDFVEAMAELAFIHEQRSEFKPARTLYEKLLKLNFSPQDVLLRLISLSLRMNQPEKALKYMRQGPDTIPFKLTVAGLFIDSRHYLQGETLLKQIAARDDAPVDVYLLLADLNYEQRRDLPMALSWLDKVPPQSKAAPRAALLRIQLLGEAGKEQEALAVTRQSQKQFEDAPQFWELEIRLLARQQQMPQALEIARKAAKKWPNNADMAFLLGSLLDESGDKKEAFKVMEHILTLHPENYQALNYVGYTLAEENRDLEKALSLLVKADELSPNQSYIVDSLAWVLYKLGRNEEALKEIRRAVKLDEHVDASIWEHYGDIASKMGLKDEARTAYQKALDLKPANADALRKRLSQL